MKKHQKRLLALLMTLAMTVTVFPMGALADDTQTDVIESVSQDTGESIDENTEVSSEETVSEEPTVDGSEEAEEPVDEETSEEKNAECEHTYGAWDYNEESGNFVRSCADCGETEENAEPEEISALLDEVSVAEGDSEAAKAVVDKAVADGVITETVAETILATTEVSTLDGEGTTAVQEEKGWYYDTSVDKTETGESAHRYRHTSDDVTDMTDNRFVPTEITNLIKAIGEADGYDAQAELVAKANEDGVIANSLKARWCNGDGSFITEFTNGDYTIKFEPNDDERTYTAVVSGTGNNYSDRISWSGATQQWILYRNITTTVKIADDAEFTTLPTGVFANFKISNIEWAKNNKITIIGSNAFMNNNITDGIIYVPEGVEKLEAYAFTNNAGNGFQKVTEAHLPESFVSGSVYSFGNNTNENALIKLYGKTTNTENYANTYNFIYMDLNNYNSGTIEGTSIKFEYSNGSLTLSGTGAMPDFASVNDVPWKDNLGDITSITIGSGITSIGAYAFMGTQAENIIIPSAATKIGAYAFANVSTLKELVVPPNVSEIGTDAFSGTNCKIYTTNSKLTGSYGASEGNVINADFAQDMTELSSKSTAGTYVIFKDNVAYVIGNGTISGGSWHGKDRPDEFKNHLKNIDTVKFVHSDTGTGITSIEGAVFTGYEQSEIAEGIKYVDFGDQLKTIGNNVFMSTSIENIVIPAQLTYIGAYTFGHYQGYGVTPKTVTFEGNTDISFAMADADKNYPDRKYSHSNFTHNNGEESKIIFFGAEGTNAVDYAKESSAKFFVRDKSGDLNDTLKWGLTPAETSGTYTLVVYGTGDMPNYKPTNVGSRPWAAYADSITGIEVSGGVTSVGNYAFSGLSNVTSLALGDDITSIGQYSFFDLTSLSGTVRLPSKVANIGECAFALSSKGGEETALSFIVTNENCTIADDYKENRYASTDTKAVSSGPIGAGSGTNPSSNVVYTIYENEDEPGTYRIEFEGSGVTASCGWDARNRPAGISDYADKITKVVIGDGITKINDGVCAYFTSLKEVIWPSNDISLPNNAFMSSFAESITELTVPANVTYLGAYAFGRYQGVGAKFTSITVENLNLAYYGYDTSQTGGGKEFNSGDMNGTTLYVRAGGADNTTKKYAEVFGYKYIDLTDSNNLAETEDAENNIKYSLYSGILRIEPIDPTKESTIPANIKDITDARKANVKQIILGNGITKIADNAFMDYTALEKVELNPNLKSIGENAFAITAGTTAAKLTTLIPKVTAVAATAFANRTNVDITVYDGTPGEETLGGKTGVTVKKTFYVLLIGNSYSQDASNYPMSNELSGSKLYEMIKNNVDKDTEVVVGLAMNGGKTMSWHATKSRNDESVYSFSICKDNKWTGVGTTTSAKALTYLPWDYVTLQPYATETRSGESADVAADRPEYKYDAEFKSLTNSLGYMIDFVDTNAPQSKIYLYMPWNEVGTEDASLKINSGMDGYNNVVKTLVNTTYTGTTSERTFEAVIPVGTAVQNAKTTYLALLKYSKGENASSLADDNNYGMQRDGGHLSLLIGRYMASMTFAKTLMPNVSVDDLAKKVSFYVSPNIGTLPADYKDIVKTSVANAVEKKDGVTAIDGKEVSPATTAKNAIDTKVAEENYVANVVKGKAASEYPTAIKAMAEDILADLTATYPELKVGDVAVDSATSKDASGRDVTTYTASIPVSFGYDTVTVTVTWGSTGNTQTTVKAVYDVEYYKETLKSDGTTEYVKADTERKSDKVDSTVSVTPVEDKYEHYHVNTANSILTGTVITPTVEGEDAKVNVLTLKVYYDLDTYTVSYNADNGSAVESQTVKHGQTVTVKEAPAKEGHTFTSWLTGNVEYQPSATFTAEENVSFTAQWNVNQYEVTFDNDGTVTTVTADYGTTVTAPTAPTKTGYTFAGWYKEDTNEEWNFGTDTVPVNGITLKAHWTINQYDVTYDSNGGSKVETVTVDYKTTVTVAEGPTKDGWTFTEWKSGETSYQPNDKIEVTDNITLVAQYVPNKTPVVPGDVVKYMVEYYKENLDGTYEKVDADSTIKGDKIGSTVTAEDKAYDHYVLNKEKSTLSGKLVAISSPSDIVTLSVYYDLDEHAVAFDLKDGSEASVQTVKHGKTAEKPADPGRTGFRFLGWFADENLTTEFDFSQAIEEDTTVYAGWKKKSTESSDSSYTGGSSSTSGGGSSSSSKNDVTADKETENGSIKIDKDSASKGSTVTITVTPDEGYETDKVTVTDKNGKEIEVTDKGDGKYTFTMPATGVDVTADFKEATGDSAEEEPTVITMQIGNTDVTVNEKTITNDVAPVIRNDRTLVPIRVVTETLGGTVDWDDATKTVTLNIDGKEIKMTIGVVLEKYGVAPTIIDDRTYVPIRFVAEELGAEVQWNEETKVVTIIKK